MENGNLPVPLSEELDRLAERDRLEALEQLNAAAENTNDPSQAREIMVKGKLLADALKRVAAPFEESRLAGKASVLAARRLGFLLAELSPKRNYSGTPRASGSNLISAQPSERGRVMRQIGIGKGLTRDTMRLASVADPDFQRYIQRQDKIPSLTGALKNCAPEPRLTRTPPDSSWTGTRRRRAGVKTPKNPSIDEGYSLIVRALGHLSAVASPGPQGSSQQKKKALSSAINLLYQAEDLLKPYRGGY